MGSWNETFERLLPPAGYSEGMGDFEHWAFPAFMGPFGVLSEGGSPTQQGAYQLLSHPTAQSGLTKAQVV